MRGGGRSNNRFGHTNTVPPPPPRQGHHQMFYNNQTPVQESPFAGPAVIEHQHKEEWKKRQEVFDKIMRENPKSVEKRKEEYKKLDKKHRLAFFYPDGVTLESIPPLDPPADWDDRVQKTIEDLQGYVKELFISRKRNREQREEQPNQPLPDSHPAVATWLRANPKPDDPMRLVGWQEDYDGVRELESSDELESVESEENMYDDAEEQAELASYVPAVSFLNSLAECPPMSAGFLVMALAFQSEDNSLCYCP
jgi:hypothetical protein